MITAPLVLTCGEPAGIGIEIAGLAWQHLHAQKAAAFFLLGDYDYITQRLHGAAINVAVKAIADPSDAHKMFPQALPVLHRSLPVFASPGQIAAENALEVIASLSAAVDLVLAKQACAMVTNPIAKQALYKAGFLYEGHSDYLEHLAKKNGFPKAQAVMMLVAQAQPILRTIPVTIHKALADVPTCLTTQKIISQAVIVAQDLRRFFHINHPRLAITGLNPHAGEDGTMGTEEQTIILPALTALRSMGTDIIGPMPADTAFHQEARASYDAILCMYHDQALIPVKTLDFHGGVNVTLGLPFVRTSPDHGTALNLAGKGCARPDSLIAAIRMAYAMVTV